MSFKITLHRENVFFYCCVSSMWPQPTWLFALYLCVRLVFPIFLRTANWKPGNYREEQKACNHGGFVDVNIEWILGQRSIICNDLRQKKRPKKKQKFIISFIFRNCLSTTQNFHYKNVFYSNFQFLKLSSIIISLSLSFLVGVASYPGSDVSGAV